MSVDATTPTTVVATPGTKSTTATTAVPGIADNFQTFLTLLTTQLQNQNPLDPLDTNQFTQQLVQFAGVEQQLRSNDQLKSLIDIEKSAQATAALAYVGNTVAVDGSTAQLNGSANWNLKADNAAAATITVRAANGQTAFSGNYNLAQGSNNFVWDGKGNDGSSWPAGTYTVAVSAKDPSGNDVPVATEVLGVVDSVDLTATPALLSIAGQNYTTSQIKRVIRAGGTG